MFRRFLRFLPGAALTLGLLCMSPGAYAAGEPARTITPEQAILLALDKAKAGDLGPAEALSRIFFDRHMPAAAHALLARSHRLVGDHARAAGHYRLALAAAPSSLLHTELASLLLEGGDDDGARYHLERALELGPPPDVLGRTQALLRALRGQEGPYGAARVGVAASSNINNGSLRDTVELGGLEFELSRDARAKSGIGPTLDGEAGYRWRLRPDLGAFAQADLYAVDYLGQKEDRAIAAAGSGLEYRHGLFLYRPAVRLSHERYAGEGLRNGVELDNLVSPAPWGKARFEFRLVPGWFDGLNDQRGFRRLRAEASAILGLQPRLRLRFDLGTAFEDHAQGYDSNARWAAAASADYLLASGNIVRAQLGYGWRRYGAEDPLFGERRREHELTFGATLVLAGWSWQGFAPEIGAVRKETFSSIGFYDRSGTDIVVAATKSF